MSPNNKAEDFMTKNPETVSPDAVLEDILLKMKERRRDGLLVVKGKSLVGILFYVDTLLQSPKTKVNEIMEKKVVAVPPEMDMQGVARLMFRRGFSRLPVVDKQGKLLGLLRNYDVIRASIERVTPRKIETTKKMISAIHKVGISTKIEEIKIQTLIPTQLKVYLDELRAREYELQKGLAEPILIIRNGSREILVDGHHRVVAAGNLKIEKMKAYVITLDKEVSLGLEKNAEKQGLKNPKDIEVVDGYSPYTLPLVLENGEVKKLV